MTRSAFINFGEMLAGAYGQVFFSRSRIFAIFLAIASFVDPYIGCSGLFCALVAMLLGTVARLNPLYMRSGAYTFNALLTGFALGACYRFTAGFAAVLILSSGLTLLFTVWLSGVTEKNKLPFLSLPFIVCVWIIFLNARSFNTGILQIRGVGGCNGSWCAVLNSASLKAQSVFPPAWLFYFKTMAAIFFQNNVLAGLLIVTGMILYSRIAFILSLTGFFSGYLYFQFVQGTHGDINYAAYASSHILTALALGGFFLVPSRRSFMLVILAAPLTGLLANALGKAATTLALPLYSLPFSVCVILALSFIKHAPASGMFQLVHFQEFSPEKNLYAFVTFMARFKRETANIIHLPFFGEWTVSQGHNGDMTHKDDWRFAWDFVVKDEHKRTFKLPGATTADFYCYGLPVLAPADGLVTTIEDGIGDNEIGEVNLAQNWGNTIVIRHGDYLYSKLCHLKKGSFKVSQGDLVKKGSLLALCGNSGRSPEPHIHFQLQSSAQIGAASISHPIGYYVTEENCCYRLNYFDVPAEDDILFRPEPAPALVKTFSFAPGKKFNFTISGNTAGREQQWEIFTDEFNNTFIQCKVTEAVAYFKFDDTMFYFTAYRGSRNCLLFYFYLGAYRISLARFKSLKVHDVFSIADLYSEPIKILQDAFAPFHIFLKGRYRSFTTGNSLSADGLKIVSRIRSGRLGKNVNVEIEMAGQKISRIKITERNKCIVAENI